MNINVIENEVERIINTHTAVVTQQLLDEIDTEFEKINPQTGQRSYSTKEHVMACALEFTLRHQGKMKIPVAVKGEKYAWRHDWPFSEEPLVLIDLKRTPDYSANISISSIEQKEQSYNMRQLTHFVAFGTNIEIITEKNLGDMLTFEFHMMLGVKASLKHSFKPYRNKDYQLLKVRQK